MQEKKYSVLSGNQVQDIKDNWPKLDSEMNKILLGQKLKDNNPEAVKFGIIQNFSINKNIPVENRFSKLLQKITSVSEVVIKDKFNEKSGQVKEIESKEDVGYIMFDMPDEILISPISIIE